MASDIDDLFRYVFIWHAVSDACPVCQALNGREYRGQDLFDAQLIDTNFGPIWQLDEDHSLTHPNCRCYLEVKAWVELGEWQPYRELQQNLSNIRRETITRYGQAVTIFRDVETGRFTTE